MAAHLEEAHGTLMCRGTPVEKHCTRVSLLVGTDNEAAPFSVQGGGIVIHTVLSVQVGLVIRIYEKASLSIQIMMYG